MFREILDTIFLSAVDPWERMFIMILFVCIMDNIFDLIKSIIGGVRR